MTTGHNSGGSHRLLDTDVASYIFGGKPEASVYIPHLTGFVGLLSFVTVAEMLKGALLAKWGQPRIDALEHFIHGNYVVLPYNLEVVRQWAHLCTACSRGGFTVGSNDAWIAASAVAFGCPIVARDTAFREMSKYYPALTVYP